MKISNGLAMLLGLNLATVCLGFKEGSLHNILKFSLVSVFVLYLLLYGKPKL